MVKFQVCKGKKISEENFCSIIQKRKRRTKQDCKESNILSQSPLNKEGTYQN